MNAFYFSSETMNATIFSIEAMNASIFPISLCFTCNEGCRFHTNVGMIIVVIPFLVHGRKFAFSTHLLVEIQSQASGQYS